MASAIVLEDTVVTPGDATVTLTFNGTTPGNKVVSFPDKDMTVASTNEANLSYKPTPVAITSWSYVTTTITLNVASHTFVAGDYIEVSGLTATKNIPNGVHLVTSVTATTIVFTYTLTPTGTAGVSSATVKGYMTVNGRTNGIGEGQTWQDVTASMVSGTTYTNSTGKPIMLKVTSGTTNISMTIGGVLISASANAVNSEVIGIVPVGSTYVVTATITKWLELR